MAKQIFYCGECDEKTEFNDGVCEECGQYVSYYDGAETEEEAEEIYQREQAYWKKDEKTDFDPIHEDAYMEEYTIY